MDTTELTSLSKALTSLHSSVPAAGGQLPALQAQLKKLFTLQKTLGLDASIDAKTKKGMLAALQIEIQVVMQRIANLQAGNRKQDPKENAPITEASVPTAIERDDRDPLSLLNDFHPRQKYKVDVTV